MENRSSLGLFFLSSERRITWLRSKRLVADWIMTMEWTVTPLADSFGTITNCGIVLKGIKRRKTGDLRSQLGYP
jgi:hypothetical protein